MVEFRISVDLSSIAGINQLVLAQAMPMLGQAVRAVAQATQSNWIQAVQSAKLWSGEKDAYSASIQWREAGPLSALVWTEYKHAEEIETGRPARDLKKMLDTSNKVRRTKDGRRFLVIPFCHNVEAMPAHVYDAASQLRASTIVGQTQRRAGEITSASFGQGMVPMSEKRQRRNPYLKSTATHQNVMVNKNIYSWGGRLLPGAMGPNPFGKSDRFAGMVRFDTSTPGAKRSTYLTFRIMMEGSTGWIVPAQPGQFLAKKVAEEMQPLAEKVFTEAVLRSMR